MTTKKNQSHDSPLEGWIVEDKTGWKYNHLRLPKNSELKETARKLRKAGVLSEVLFWQAFKNKKLLRWDIDRQVIIGNYIVDFFIPELGLIVEIDGESHEYKGRCDMEREQCLNSLGLKVLHYSDLEVKKSFEYVADSFQQAIQARVLEIEEFISFNQFNK